MRDKPCTRTRQAARIGWRNDARANRPHEQDATGAGGPWQGDPSPRWRLHRLGKGKLLRKAPAPDSPFRCAEGARAPRREPCSRWGNGSPAAIRPFRRAAAVTVPCPGGVTAGLCPARLLPEGDGSSRGRALPQPGSCRRRNPGADRGCRVPEMRTRPGQERVPLLGSGCQRPSPGTSLRCLSGHHRRLLVRYSSTDSTIRNSTETSPACLRSIIFGSAAHIR